MKNFKSLLKQRKFQILIGLISTSLIAGTVAIIVVATRPKTPSLENPVKDTNLTPLQESQTNFGNFGSETIIIDWSESEQKLTFKVGNREPISLETFKTQAKTQEIENTDKWTNLATLIQNKGTKLTIDTDTHFENLIKESSYDDAKTILNDESIAKYGNLKDLNNYRLIYKQLTPESQRVWEIKTTNSKAQITDFVALKTQLIKQGITKSEVDKLDSLENLTNAVSGLTGNVDLTDKGKLKYNEVVNQFYDSLNEILIKKNHDFLYVLEHQISTSQLSQFDKECLDFELTDREILIYSMKNYQIIREKFFTTIDQFRANPTDNDNKRYQDAVNVAKQEYTNIWNQYKATLINKVQSITQELDSRFEQLTNQEQTTLTEIKTNLTQYFETNPLNPSLVIDVNAKDEENFFWEEKIDMLEIVEGINTLFQEWVFPDAVSIFKKIENLGQSNKYYLEIGIHQEIKSFSLDLFLFIYQTWIALDKKYEIHGVLEQNLYLDVFKIDQIQFWQTWKEHETKIIKKLQAIIQYMNSKFNQLTNEEKTILSTLAPFLEQFKIKTKLIQITQWQIVYEREIKQQIRLSILNQLLLLNNQKYHTEFDNTITELWSNYTCENVILKNDVFNDVTNFPKNPTSIDSELYQNIAVKIERFLQLINSFEIKFTKKLQSIIQEIEVNSEQLTSSEQTALIKLKDILEKLVLKQSNWEEIDFKSCPSDNSDPVQSDSTQSNSGATNSVNQSIFNITSVNDDNFQSSDIIIGLSGLIPILIMGIILVKKIWTKFKKPFRK